ncbi:distal tail protein Dit [Neobacillus rhizosphaerae]|uniref:distal tail protein Dit n=1 Tax=Neobacillus rhizosphaerae TaxID=2880965 RepID=UPI003D290B80
MFTVTFSEHNLTDYFTVESVQRSILPPREVNLLEVPARHGAYFQSSRYGVREIQVKIIVKASTNVDLMNTMRFLAYCLDIDKPTELVFSDEPNRVYYAILSDKTDIEEILSIGRGTLNFLCPEPFAYSSEIKTIAPDGDGYFLFDNQGTTTTFPKFTTTFAGEATFLSLTSPDGVILIGNPHEAESTKIPAQQTILNDPMRSVQGWVPAGAILDAGRQNVGTIAVRSDGEGIICTDYGAGTKGSGIWHGAGYRKNLSQTVKDFTVKVRLDFSSQDGTSKLDGNQKGRLEIYLFSANGTKIGKLVMRDSYSAYEFNIPEIFIQNTTFLVSEPKAPAGKKISQKEYTYYTLTANHTVEYLAKKFGLSQASLRALNGWSGSKTSVTKGTRIKVGSKTVTKVIYPEHVGSYNDFFGEFTLSRVGTKWYAEVSRMDSNFRKSKTISKTFYDKSGKYTKEELAYIVISFLQYETDPVVQKMSVTDIKVYKHNSITEVDTPAIFQAEDILEIDLASSIVTLNGDPFMTEVDVGSVFFPIYEGQTEVKVSTNDQNASHSADFVERYL